jgi:hypothetical protein
MRQDKVLALERRKAELTDADVRALAQDVHRLFQQAIDGTRALTSQVAALRDRLRDRRERIAGR